MNLLKPVCFNLKMHESFKMKKLAFLLIKNKLTAYSVLVINLLQRVFQLKVSAFCYREVLYEVSFLLVRAWASLPFSWVFFLFTYPTCFRLNNPFLKLNLSQPTAFFVQNVQFHLLTQSNNDLYTHILSYLKLV